MIRDFRGIDQLSPTDFEIFVRDLFLASGWSDAEITKAGREFKYGDGGVDIFAYKGKRKFAIEVKHRNSSTTVDVKALNQLVTGAQLANVSNKILVTNSYFTSEVKARALRLGVELIDRDELQNLWVMKHSEIGRDIKPRKYQQDVIDEALRKHNAGKNKLLIEMATGLGKTYTVAHLIKRLIQDLPERPRILFLAHQVEILLQSVTAFKNVLGIGNYSFSACFSGTAPEDTDFVFASFDTLYGQLAALTKNTFDFVVVDEAHHTPARTYSEVVNLFQSRLLVGLTATPYRADRQDVLSFFGGADGHIGKFDLVWALKHGKLAFPRYLVLLDDLDLDKITQLESGLSISDLDKKLFLHKKDEEVVRIIEKTVEEQEIQRVKGIVFCRSISHMRHLIGFFQLGSATLVHSQMQDQERRENIRSFREGDVRYILVCDLFNEGIDIPETNLLVFMRSTSSKTIWLQQLGRGLRKTPNKDYVYVLDFVGSLERLNEVRELTRSIDRTPVDKESLTDGMEGSRVTSVFHDGTLDVQYSENAAKVLNLIEKMQFELNSRELLLEKLRQHKELNQSTPDISEVEHALEDIGLDQIATHFGSYYAYITAAFYDNFNKQGMILRIEKHITRFYQEHKILPSLKAITAHFTLNCLPEFSEKDIKALIPHYDWLAEDVTATVPIVVTENNSQREALVPCPIIEKHRKNITSRSDLKKLTDRERAEIEKKYRSVSVFLKKLGDAS